MLKIYLHLIVAVIMFISPSYICAKESRTYTLNLINNSDNVYKITINGGKRYNAQNNVSISPGKTYKISITKQGDVGWGKKATYNGFIKDKEGNICGIITIEAPTMDCGLAVIVVGAGDANSLCVRKPVSLCYSEFPQGSGSVNIQPLMK